MNAKITNLQPVRNYKKGARVHTKAGKIAYVLEANEGNAVVLVRFLNNATALIPARWILWEK